MSTHSSQSPKSRGGGQREETRGGGGGTTLQTTLTIHIAALMYTLSHLWSVLTNLGPISSANLKRESQANLSKANLRLSLHSASWLCRLVDVALSHHCACGALVIIVLSLCLAL